MESLKSQYETIRSKMVELFIEENLVDYALKICEKYHEFNYLVRYIM